MGSGKRRERSVADARSSIRARVTSMLRSARAALRAAHHALRTGWRWQRRHRIDRRLLIGVLAVVGATLGIALAGNVHHRVGPVNVQFALRPTFHGGAEVDVPPLGRLTMHSHAGPMRVRATVTGISLTDAQRVLTGGESREALTRQVDRDVRDALFELLAKTLVLALLGGTGLVLLTFRRWRPTAAAAVTTVAALLATGGLAAVTWDTKALSQPKYTGVLASAPSLIGNIDDIQNRFDSYRAELSKIVTNVSKLYNAASTLPTAPAGNATAVLWVSDIHDNPEAFSVMSSLVSQFKVKAIVDSGDLSDHGTITENQFAAPIGIMGVPYVYVRGNHDSTSATQRFVESRRNAVVLDQGRVAEVAGLRFAGIGDPLFTPRKNQVQDEESDHDTLVASGEILADALRGAVPPVDVAVVHDPVMAQPLFGQVPLVLDGHVHHRDSHLQDKTLELTQGSSGGAGLRNLEGEKPLPLELSILYFDPGTHRLVAVDDVTVSGLGGESVQIDRHSASSYLHQDTSTSTPSPS
jgi:predicted phosphodiesterase